MIYSSFHCFFGPQAVISSADRRDAFHQLDKEKGRPGGAAFFFVFI